MLEPILVFLRFFIVLKRDDTVAAALLQPKSLLLAEEQAHGGDYIPLLLNEINSVCLISQPSTPYNKGLLKAIRLTFSRFLAALWQRVTQIVFWVAHSLRYHEL